MRTTIKNLFFIFMIVFYCCSNEQNIPEQELECDGFLSDTLKSFADINWSINNWVSNWLTQPIPEPFSDLPVLTVQHRIKSAFSLFYPLEKGSLSPLPPVPD